MKEILQIVPALPPDVSGVGDYAYLLASQLRQDFKITTHFLIAKGKKIEANHDLDFSSQYLPRIDEHELCKFLEQKSKQNLVVLLHYVGYGYAQRGCPFWLINGINAWKKQFPEAKLITMFHELSATGRPPWTSAFWLSGIQRRLAGRLATISDKVITNKESYSSEIKRLSKSKFVQVSALPVFSTVGEVTTPQKLSSRKANLIIFGSSGHKRWVYQDSQQQLSSVCKYLNIDVIYDIGPSINSRPQHINNTPIIALGTLPKSEISDILASSLVGFFNYNPAFLSKSTIFAAYCSHGLLPVSADNFYTVEDGIKPRQTFVTPEQYETVLTDFSLMQAIASNAFEWYEGHSLPTQGQAFADLVISLANIRSRE